MSEKRIFVEGGGDSKEMHARCREGFRKLLENSGFAKRVPRIVACGGRNDTYATFKTAHDSGNYDYVALLVDSEDPVTDIEKPWEHLTTRDGWPRPDKATDDQVFLMTTCMETWMVADPDSLKKHFKDGAKACLKERSLPPVTKLEARDRHEVQNKLIAATTSCTNKYEKNKRSFDVLGVVDPKILSTRLDSFARMIRILKTKL